MIGSHVAFTIERQITSDRRVLYQLSAKVDRRPIGDYSRLGTLQDVADVARFIVHEVLTDKELKGV